MSHPDQQVAEALDRTARDYAAATDAPPPELTDDTAAYIRYLRDARARAALPRLHATPRPNRKRRYLNRADIPRRRSAAEAPTPARPPVPWQGTPEYERARQVLGQLADFGEAAVAAARLEAAPGTSTAELLIAAAELVASAGQPHPSGPERNRTESAPARTAPHGLACETDGTLLDPDGTCLTCAATQPLDNTPKDEQQ